MWPGSFYYYLIKSVFLFLTHLLPKILQQEKLSKLLRPFSGTNTTQNIGPALHCLLLLKSSLIQMHMRQKLILKKLHCSLAFHLSLSFLLYFFPSFFLLVGINFTKLYFGGKRLGKTSEEGQGQWFTTQLQKKNSRCMGFLVDLIFFWPFSQACVTELCSFRHV